MSSMHCPAVGGIAMQKTASKAAAYAHAPLSTQKGCSAYRQHAMRIKRRASSSIPSAALSAKASIADRPRIDAAPTVAAGSDGTVLDCVVVGGGISGLATAQALVAEHPEVSLILTEGRERVGGNITTRSNEEGFLWEEGPNSFQPSDAMLKAAVDAGIVDELVFGDPTAPRFVYWEGELLPTPSGPDVVTFRLLSLWGKIRAGLGALGVKQPMPDEEESVETFVRRNLGDEVFERLIEPFCSGVYSGDPSKLSMKAAFGKVYDLEKEGGSIIGGVIKQMQRKKANPPPPRDSRLPPKPPGQTVASFRNGLMTLPSAIATRLDGKIRVQWKLREITRGRDGIFTLFYDTPEGAREVRTRSVALTVPAYVVAELVRLEVPNASDALMGFDYPPVAAVSLAYPLAAIREERKAADGTLPGFGQLHPRSQGVTTLGTLYSSSLFPGRAPAGQQLLLNYIGGSLNRTVVELSQEELVAFVDKDLRKKGMLLKADAPAPVVVGVRVWPRAIPQFNIAHMDVLEEIKQDLAEAGWDGVKLGGNYVAGVALGKCVEFGYDFATEVATYLEQQAPASSGTGTSASSSSQDDVMFV